jgi:hypothetical protein
MFAFSFLGLIVLLLVPESPYFLAIRFGNVEGSRKR